jgi:MFS family permease
MLFAARTVRMFGYGLLSVVLVLYLAERGLRTQRIGLLLTLTLVGDTAISLWLTTMADRIGRRVTLVIGAGLVLFAGIVFATTGNFALLLVAATIGVISPSGYEVGPFLAVEQAALSQTASGNDRTRLFAWYNLAGSLATAVGALCGGYLAQLVRSTGATQLQSYQVAVVAYAAGGVLLVLLFSQVTPEVEARDSASSSSTVATRFGLGRSRSMVLKLSGLFAMDAFAGGFVMQSLVAYWFHVRFGVQPGVLGSILFGANVLAAVSALSAARLARRFGLLNTMVFTHLPSNVLLILVPLMPSLPLAIAVLLLRFSISQMDVPTRQSYTMAAVSPEERSAAGGVTGVARTVGASLSPVIAGWMLGVVALLSAPFFVAGSVKIAYDLLLYATFRKIKLPEG